MQTLKCDYLFRERRVILSCLLLLSICLRFLSISLLLCFRLCFADACQTWHASVRHAHMTICTINVLLNRIPTQKGPIHARRSCPILIIQRYAIFDPTSKTLAKFRKTLNSVSKTNRVREIWFLCFHLREKIAILLSRTLF